MIKIAIASEKEMVAQHFGHCESFHIYNIDNDVLKFEGFLQNPGHKPGFLPVFLANNEVNVIISGGMGKGATDLFSEKGIEVIVGAHGITGNVAKEFHLGRLESTGSVCHEHQHHDECGK